MKTKRAAKVPAKQIAAYTHPAPSSTEQQPDSKPGNYYVSIRDGERYGLLAGPFVNDHAAALAMVDAARTEAFRVNRDQATWAGFGTVRMPSEYTKPGLLNDALGLKLGGG